MAKNAPKVIYFILGILFLSRCYFEKGFDPIFLIACLVAGGFVYLFGEKPLQA